MFRQGLAQEARRGGGTGGKLRSPDDVLGQLGQVGGAAQRRLFFAAFGQAPRHRQTVCGLAVRRPEEGNAHFESVCHGVPVHQAQLEVAELTVLEFETEHVLQGPHALFRDMAFIEPCLAAQRPRKRRGRNRMVHRFEALAHQGRVCLRVPVARVTGVQLVRALAA